MSERKSKNIVIIALCITLIFMGVGFAALSQTLTINGTATVTGTWDVHFASLADNTSALIENTANQGTSTQASLDDTSTTGTVAFNLVKPGDQVQYKAVIKNYGNIEALLSTYTSTLNNDAHILRSVTIAGTEVATDDESAVTAPAALSLAQDDEVEVLITYTFDPEQTTLPEFNTDTDGNTENGNDAYQVTDTLTFGFVQK